MELWRERVAPIVEGCTTDYEKAQAIYAWECTNIAYDVEFKIYHASECWEQRKGVCQAYSELFVKLAKGCDLQAIMVTGKSKNGFSPDGEGRHAWVKVNTEKGWILIDATWGAGWVSGDYSQFTFADHDMTWFDADPAIMVFTHFPSDEEHQLLSNPLTESQYKKLPILKPDVGFVGFDGRQVLNYFLSNPEGSFPVYPRNCWQMKDRVKLIEVPMEGNLKIGETYTFKIQCIDTSLVIANYNNYANWINNMDDWERDGDIYTKVFQPTSGWWNFSILARSRNQEEIVTILSYGIVE